MAHLVDELDLPDFDFFAWDAGGTAARPALAATRQAWTSPSATCRPSSIILVPPTASIPGTWPWSHKAWEPVAVAAWVHDYAPPIRCQVLAAPAFKVKLHVPSPGRDCGFCRRWGNFYVQSYVKARFLTRDAERQADDRDPLISRAISSTSCSNSTVSPGGWSPTPRLWSP